VSGGLSTSGIDMNGLGQTKIVAFKQIGPRLLKELPGGTMHGRPVDIKMVFR